MLTIVSWNIQYGKGVDGHIDLSRIAREILIDGFPDLICLQEVSRTILPPTTGVIRLQNCKKFFRNTNLFLERHMTVQEE